MHEYFLRVSMIPHGSSDYTLRTTVIFPLPPMSNFEDLQKKDVIVEYYSVVFKTLHM